MANQSGAVYVYSRGGIALRLDLVVRDVREASEAEIEAGSVGSAGLSVLAAATPGPHLH